jgi:DNA helicase-2/ATP-dependent DNA helicase PcrA
MQAEGAASFSTGFVSVKSKFGEIAQQREEESRLRALDKRAAEQSKIVNDKAPKGAKRQIEGQGTISSFFGKKARTDDVSVAVSQAAHRLPPASVSKTSPAPLRDVSNINKPRDSNPLSSSKPLSTLQHRVRAAPSIHRRPLTQSTSDPTVRPDNGYIFLSSPPPQLEEEDDPEPPKVEPPKITASHTSSFKPASTFHSTSMSSVPSQRRTLGLGKMKPWSARGGKR